MVKSGKHFDDRFKPHTRLKHFILEAYLEAWTRKMLLREGAGNVLYYVDACAGTGSDAVGNSGSPVIAAREAAKAMGQLQKREFDRDVVINVLAIERMPKRYKQLVKNLAPFGPTARALPGELSDHIDEIETRAGDDPVLYFIDPFGLAPLRAEDVRKALTKAKREVFILFADQAALRHFGCASAIEPDEDFGQGSIFPSGAGEDSAGSEVAEDEEEGQLEMNAERAIEILDAAFGDHRWYDRVHAVSQTKVRDEFLNAYEDMLREWGATHVLRLPIRSSLNQHVYHLIHASKSKYGYRQMKKSAQEGLNIGPLGGSAVDTIRLLLRTNIAEVEKTARIHFAGRTIRWAPDPKNRRSDNVSDWVLDHTPIFPAELAELKKRLIGLRRRGEKTILLDFPPLASE